MSSNYILYDKTMLIQLKNQNTFNIVNYVIIHLAAMLAAILIFIIILNIQVSSNWCINSKI